MARSTSTAEQVRFGHAVAAALAGARAKKEWTVRELAAATDISIDTIRTLESGRVSSPGLWAMWLLSEALAVDLHALASGAGALARSSDK